MVEYIYSPIVKTTRANRNIIPILSIPAPPDEFDTDDMLRIKEKRIKNITAVSEAISNSFVSIHGYEIGIDKLLSARFKTLVAHATSPKYCQPINVLLVIEKCHLAPTLWK